jgi:LysM repeat protein
MDVSDAQTFWIGVDKELKMNVKKIFPVLVVLSMLFSLGINTGIARAADVSGCTEYYTVVRGDYLSKIASKFGVAWHWLAEINKLTNPSRIYPGQKLCVEMDETVVCTKEYVVKSGDYLMKIAKKYGVTWQWLAEINDILRPGRIFPGQRLCVELSVNPVCIETYTVKSGDYLSKIAKKFGVSWPWLAEINDLKNPSRIYPGQELCVALGED